MQWILPLILKHKWVLPALVLIILVTILLLFWLPSQAAQYRQELNAIRRQEIEPARRALSTFTELSAREIASSRAYAATGDELFLKEYRQARNAALLALASLSEPDWIPESARDSMLTCNLIDAHEIWSSVPQSVAAGHIPREAHVNDLIPQQRRYLHMLMCLQQVNLALTQRDQEVQALATVSDYRQRLVTRGLLGMALIAGLASVILGRGVMHAARTMATVNGELERQVTERTRAAHELSKALALVEQRERRRHSHTLHDDLQQDLYGVQLKFRMSENTDNSEEAQRMRTQAMELLSKSIHTTRMMAIELDPPVLDDSLCEGLYWVGQHMKERFDLHVDTSCKAQWIESEFQSVVVNIVRELLFNVVKHAAVDHAEVLAYQDGDNLHVKVIDYGRGLRDNQPGKGLRSIRQRASLLGGSFSIKTDEEQGTIAHLIIPNPEPEDNALVVNVGGDNSTALDNS